MAGHREDGSISGNNRKSINLIMAQRQNDWLAPMLFTVWDSALGVRG
jgi:hypothetical protein